MDFVELKLTEQEASAALTAIYTLYNSEAAKKLTFFEQDTEDNNKLKLKPLSAKEVAAYEDSITNMAILSNLFARLKTQLEVMSTKQD